MIDLNESYSPNLIKVIISFRKYYHLIISSFSPSFKNKITNRVSSEYRKKLIIHLDDFNQNLWSALIIDYQNIHPPPSLSIKEIYFDFVKSIKTRNYLETLLFLATFNNTKDFLANNIHQLDNVWQIWKDNSNDEDHNNSKYVKGSSFFVDENEITLSYFAEFVKQIDNDKVINYTDVSWIDKANTHLWAITVITEELQNHLKHNDELLFKKLGINDPDAPSRILITSYNDTSIENWSQKIINAKQKYRFDNLFDDPPNNIEFSHFNMYELSLHDMLIDLDLWLTHFGFALNKYMTDMITELKTSHTIIDTLIIKTSIRNALKFLEIKYFVHLRKLLDLSIYKQYFECQS